MKKIIRVYEAMLLNERSKMVSEILLNILLYEQPSQCEKLNSPMYKTIDLINKPKNEDE